MYEKFFRDWIVTAECCADGEHYYRVESPDGRSAAFRSKEEIREFMERYMQELSHILMDYGDYTYDASLEIEEPEPIDQPTVVSECYLVLAKATPKIESGILEKFCANPLKITAGMTLYVCTCAYEGASYGLIFDLLAESYLVLEKHLMKNMGLSYLMDKSVGKHTSVELIERLVEKSKLEITIPELCDQE